MHISIPMGSIEFINITPLNPLISKCIIKVCYVDDKPNRNNTVITKAVAKEIANSLPGSPIVGYFNEKTQDFEEHNKGLSIEDGKLVFLDMTRPYGFVDLNAKVWFQNYLDDDNVEREYLITEGYLWTGQYPETERIMTIGNNQSMELHEQSVKGQWAKNVNTNKAFFIINEAIIEKLCILGSNVEPCFEGAQIMKFSLELNSDFKSQLYSMAQELKEFLIKGGKSSMYKYAIEIGSGLWDSLYSILEERWPRLNPDGTSCGWGSEYSMEGIYEDGEVKFMILRSRKPAEKGKYLKLIFTIEEKGGVTLGEEMSEVFKTYLPADGMFALEDIEKYETARYSQMTKNDGSTVDSSEFTADKKKSTYNLDEIAEYLTLKEEYNSLKISFDILQSDYSKLKEQMFPLVEFKNSVELTAKQEMIKSFYMLSDEDKKDVVDNIMTYSLDDIEAKLSIICVRNRVNFNLDNGIPAKPPVVFNLGDNGIVSDDNAPAWIKAVENVAKKMNK